MRYRITHTTEYVYREPVPLCHNVVRLQPRDTAWQTRDSFDLTITPGPSDRHDRIDFFGNHLTWFTLQEPHRRLKIEAKSQVEVTAPILPLESGNIPWDRARDGFNANNVAATLAAKEYTFDSPYVPRHDELADYARPCFPAGAPLIKCVRELTSKIYHEFTFDTRATTIGTPVLEVLKHRHGVCQDFAHLQIGCLRSLGLAARYVSGYVLTQPPPGKARLIGADASHAWVSVFVPGHGWVDFDPTNDSLPTSEHITLAWGRDYEDVSPVKGVIIGGHGHSLFYAVDVEPIVSEAVTPVAAQAVVPVTS